MNFYIPSRARPDASTPKVLLDYGVPWQFIFLVIRPDEVELYKDVPFQQIVLPKTVNGLSATRQWIVELSYKGHHIDTLAVMLDDDITSFIYKPVTKTFGGVRKMTKTQFEKMIREFSRLLTDGDVLAASTQDRVSLARPNKSSWNFHTRVGQVMFLNVQALRSRNYRFDRVQIYHDQDLALQIVRGGFATATSNRFGHNMRPTYSAGGLQTYRKQKVINESAKKLCKLHPGLVRLKWKEKHGFRVPSRIIAWKKARKEGENK